VRRRAEEIPQDDGGRAHPGRLRDGRHGGRARQRALARRQDARAGRRKLRRALGVHRPRARDVRPGAEGKVGRSRLPGRDGARALPPGLAFVSIGARARGRIESSKSPRFYFDLRRELKAQAGGEAAFTPAISNVLALRAALGAVEEAGGVDALVHNAATLAGMTRKAAEALGLPLVAPRDHGDALTALFAPTGLESGAIVKALKSEFGSTVAGGQGELKGKIMRFAHLGYYDATDILGLIATLEIVLRRVGHRFEVGRGVAAAEEEYLRRITR